MSNLKPIIQKMRKTGRRDFLGKVSLGALGTLVGAEIVYAGNMPKDYVPVILDQDEQDPYKLFKKHKDLIVLNDKPWNIESPAHLLDDEVTPADKMFIRNNGKVPTDIDAASWKLTIEGESAQGTKSYSLAELKNNFKKHTYQLTLECGGNGRKEYNPPAKGNQWEVGAVSCAEWSGVRLSDLLNDVGLKSDAVYVGFYGADKHLSGDPNKVAISRGVPIEKAMMEETIVAYEMNGEPIPLAHGYPLRLVAGGFPASASGKWLNKLVVRDQVHDGPKMEAPSYRIPCETVAPGEKVADEDMCIIEEMPVKSLITYPKTGAMLEGKNSLDVRGHAWSGRGEITKVEYSIDFGVNWKEISVKPSRNRFAWQHFSGTVTFPKEGYYEVWARATDSTGDRQPIILPGWNPKGYLNNASHRIAVKVA